MHFLIAARNRVNPLPPILWYWGDTQVYLRSFLWFFLFSQLTDRRNCWLFLQWRHLKNLLLCWKPIELINKAKKCVAPAACAVYTIGPKRIYNIYAFKRYSINLLIFLSYAHHAPGSWITTLFSFWVPIVITTNLNKTYCKSYDGMFHLQIWTLKNAYL